MALCGLVSATLSGQACLHKTSNSRICPLQSREYVNTRMQGAAQPVTVCIIKLVYQSAEIELIEDLGFGEDCWNLGCT
jgi:predicted component of type VI protein secretion system